ncbi:MAG: hypothetical protein K9N46_07525 [Candidatus Marinimicrobia bacterium]|nr:hypothetical protein [Candidatus Neomarinimicrobiota bacterium]MCF7880573.1 hypothetical protein [Candidatus Neomarinimicrobiota bacterium]
MGQQQLLLIVLGAIIVGISVVVGINMMGTASDNANLDAVRADLLNIGSSAQGWFKRPEMMEGGGNSFNGLDFSYITFGSDTTYNNNLTAKNQNGVYDMVADSAQVTVTATPASGGAQSITATVTAGNVEIVTTPNP